MRIRNQFAEESSRGRRVQADVSWEDSDLPTRTIQFETTAPFAADLTPSPHAFLTAAAIPALHRGEKRIEIEGRVCPRLIEGLNCALTVLKGWYYPPDHPLPVIEPTDQRGPAGNPGPQPRRAAAFFSGGVDSMAMLRQNRLDFAPDHPASIRDGIFIHGFDIGGLEREGPRMHIYETALERFSEFAQQADLELVPVISNLKYLDDDWSFWGYQFHGAALAAVAHALASRWGEASIGSTYPLHMLDVWGSHPLLDGYFSSANLAVRHEGARLTRFEKVALIHDWPEALANLRVCLNVKLEAGQLNCGQCEKCVRTMLALLALGKLDQATGFPSRDVTPAMIERNNIRSPWEEMYYEELMAYMAERGRSDLADALRTRLDEWHTWLAWTEKRGWKGAIRKWDDRYLGSRLTRIMRRIR